MTKDTTTNKERAALITGASRGIGRAIALALAQRGWNIVVNYRSAAEAAASVRDAVESFGVRALVVRADVADAVAREQLVHETLRHFARLDLLVNNAGMAPRQRLDLLETTETSFDEVLAVNLKGPFFLSQLVARHMLAWRKAEPEAHPMIINLGSVSAYAAGSNRAEYCIAKAGLAMATKLFAQRLAEHGINVYEIRPGIIATDMTRVAQEKYDRMIAAGLTPIPRWGQPEDVARAVAALAEGALPFSTGEVINVDGGFHIQRL